MNKRVALAASRLATKQAEDDRRRAHNSNVIEFAMRYAAYLRCVDGHTEAVTVFTSRQSPGFYHVGFASTHSLKYWRPVMKLGPKK